MKQKLPKKRGKKLSKAYVDQQMGGTEPICWSKHTAPAPVCDLDWEPLSQCRVLSREGSDTERNEKLEKKMELFKIVHEIIHLF